MKYLLIVLLACLSLNLQAQEKCMAVTKTGNNCSRNASKDHLCTQHYNMVHKDAKILPKPRIDLPEEWSTISTDSIKRDRVYIWRDTKTNVLHIEFR